MAAFYADRYNLLLITGTTLFLCKPKELYTKIFYYQYVILA